jgi:hypothetical protein
MPVKRINQLHSSSNKNNLKPLLQVSGLIIQISIIIQTILILI